jgi:uncharacterized protein
MARIAPDDLPTPAAVRRFLAANPSFLDSFRPEGGNVIDFSAAAMHSLRNRVAEQAADKDLLLDTLRGARDIQARVQQAVLAILDVDDFAHLIHVVTSDWVDILAIDAVALALESGDQQVRWRETGVKLLGADPFKAIQPDLGGCSVRTVLEGDALFGSAAPLIRSEMLVSLSPPAPMPRGLLLLGAREPIPYQAGPGAVAVLFLASVLERCIARWLSQAP